MQPVRNCVEALVEEGLNARLAPTMPVRSAPNPDDQWFPDLVLVCQQWPDEFSESDVRRLLSLYPLARFVCAYGLWCESDGRSRDIWPLSVRVPVRCTADRMRRELEVVAGLRRPLPLTASRDEIWLFDADGPAADRFAFR
jgi:hypothetical protein